ncbi:PAS and ANTAR domain-containing protein [Mycobacterium montefiorense]|uniref:histidine kinase n=1 Tax=Mycobacterium montefiorense TaxID=154654 RepID=A0AA37PR45_9MYCO|nr:PAS and ANTAR domain-containing protein [Mycobacterium montefiorense]GBG36715.1 transcription antitermination regulator [Mycobacterium montefiorense]GKU37066.1 transcription antitermination regulator [Mycobacterium montefiorense]GKU43029.1 transcription antitermination regulator [Mycobacterium montefiorense]GKU48660.1 transcription antitermination regulator [Mycobacterium montefiorense]GKU50690.1 transcription antitermination regulator [Mycobacterium montefiorense]
MNWDLNGQSADVEQALAGGAPQWAGWFRFYFSDQRWEWSEQVQRLHGYEPGSVAPTTELVLSHKHPDDRGQVAATIDEILNTHQAFSTRHRIIDTCGQVRHVVVVGNHLHDDQGEVIGTHGFYVDVSSPPDQEREDLVTAKLAEITEQRASIEQAKGMLMLIYGIGEGPAFDLLKWLSQEANIKLRPLAEQICEDFRALGPRVSSQSDFDHLLLTAHERVDPALS